MSVKTRYQVGEVYRPATDSKREVGSVVREKNGFNRELDRAMKVFKDKKPDLILKKKQVGYLSRKYESGSNHESSVAAVGYDPYGGTSYGAFQISSQKGTMDDFIGFLEKNAPDIAKRLKSAGPSNTGGKTGKMPSVWKEIAKSQPDRFYELQFKFILDNHYRPAVNMVKEETGLDISKASFALKEVVFSTAVHHGARGGANIITSAIQNLKNKKRPLNEEEIINEIYRLRETKISFMEPELRKSVAERLRNERNDAIQLKRAHEPTVSKKV